MESLIRQMGHVAFRTPDPEGAARDLELIVGLRVTRRDDDAVFLSSNQRHYEVSFTRGAKREVAAIGLEATDRKAVEEVARRAQSEGFTIVSDKPLGPGIERAVRFIAPFGAILEVHTPVRRSEPQRYAGPGGRPKRIDHVNLKASDTLLVRDVLTKVLGMKLSDRTSGDEFLWFRAVDGYHHTVAVFLGDDALHHYGFEFQTLGEVGSMADVLASQDRPLIWGPGRHGAGGNIFAYHVDANDCVVESSVGMDRIDNDDIYEPRSWTFTPDMTGSWVNHWGAPAPSSFAAHGMPYALR